LQKLLYPKKNRSQQTADHSEKSSQQTASKQASKGRGRGRATRKKERKKSASWELTQEEEMAQATHDRRGELVL
jgi:hypothetical protein